MKTGNRQQAIVKKLKVIYFALCAMLFVLCVSARAQQPPKKMQRIGYLSPLSSSRDATRRQGFEQGLRELGYTGGQNIIVEYRFADGQLERLPELAAELVRLKADVIVAGGGSLIARTAKNATGTIPVVMTNAEDPVGDGLIASLAHPGGNVTGLTALLPDLAAKRLELLKETIPKITRAAVLWNPTVREKAIEFKETQAAAKAFAIRLQSLEVKTPNDIDGGFEAASRDRAGALIILPDPLINTLEQRIVEFAAKKRLPTSFTQTPAVDGGGLMSYGPDYRDLFRRAATYVDKILKGRKPDDLPVEQPKKFEFVINLKAAKQIGLTIPPNVLARADKVIR
jgi:putative tryptophan/tyrosine transport system substrate-binding protein